MVIHLEGHLVFVGMIILLFTLLIFMNKVLWLNQIFMPTILLDIPDLIMDLQKLLHHMDIRAALQLPQQIPPDF